MKKQPQSQQSQYPNTKAVERPPYLNQLELPKIGIFGFIHGLSYEDRE